MVRLSHAEIEHVLRSFAEAEDFSRPSHGWSRRRYAPMHIYEPAMYGLYTQLEKEFPDYVPTFDVVFESKGEVCVDWHVDFESIGPFRVGNSWEAVRDSHFVSVHFNLTPRGGSLTTLHGWPFLSWVHFLVVSRTGIYSWWHRCLNAVCGPLFRLFSKAMSNQEGIGNAFDNVRLHSVSAGEARTSYVVRMVRRGCVHVCRKSVLDAASRSDASARLSKMLMPTLSENEVVSADDIRWDLI